MSEFITQELRDAQESHAAEDAMSVMLSGRTAESLSEADKIARDAFCREYCKDFNAKRAMHRIGVTNPKTAATKGSIWLREAYCAEKIRLLVRELQPSDIVQRNDVMGGLLKEANDEGNEGNVRVAAWTQLGKMIGALETKTQSEDKTPVNIMLIPVSNMETWGSQAAKMQAELKQRASERPVIPINTICEVEALPA